MKLSEIIDIKAIKIPLRAKDKQTAIEELIDTLSQAGKISDKSKLLQAVLDREATRSTGVGQGLAIPHGKCEGLNCLVCAVGIPAQPIDFQSIDGQPVNFIVLLGSGVDQTGPHIQALARISRFMTMPSFRKAIGQARTSLEVYRAFVEHES